MSPMYMSGLPGSLVVGGVKSSDLPFCCVTSSAGSPLSIHCAGELEIDVGVWAALGATAELGLSKRF